MNRNKSTEEMMITALAESLVSGGLLPVVKEMRGALTKILNVEESDQLTTLALEGTVWNAVNKIAHENLIRCEEQVLELTDKDQRFQNLRKEEQEVVDQVREKIAKRKEKEAGNIKLTSKFGGDS